MFEQFINAMGKGTTPNVFFGPSQEMLERTLQLAKSQTEVMKDLYEDLGQEISTMAKSSDPVSMANNLHGLMSAVIQTNTQASALFMKNAQEFQNEILQLTKVSGLGLPENVVKNSTKAKKTA